MAPFTPFIAEDIYRKTGGIKESVHLEIWPKIESFDQDVIIGMSLARSFASMGLMARDTSGIKVRQPLATMIVKHDGVEPKFWLQLKEIVKDEVNVKEIIFEKNSNSDLPAVRLDTNITPELREEGEMRELVRNIQELRKKSSLNPGDVIALKIITDEDGQSLVNKFVDEIKRGTGTSDIILMIGSGEIKIGEHSFKIEIEK